MWPRKPISIEEMIALAKISGREKREFHRDLAKIRDLDCTEDYDRTDADN